MVAEIIAGFSTRSMALLADGIHMGSHVLAIGLSWLAYYVIRRLEEKGTGSQRKDRILSLSGYTSGILLLIFALMILVQAVQRFFEPREIAFREALIVAVIGLVVNVISAILLHHNKSEADNNIRAAYYHVLADAVTSLAAIAGLLAAMVWGVFYIDTIAAVLSSVVIIKWAAGLLKESGRVLVSE